MPTPYWGHLPGPKIVENRRRSEDGPRVLPDTQPSLNPKANRISVQTTNTEATETTLQPFSTPTNSNVGFSGLAPRPPSYQRPPGAAAALESDAGPQVRNSRRRSRNPTDFEADPILQAAPSSSRALPGGQQLSVSEGAPEPRGPSSVDRAMDYGDVYARHDVPYSQVDTSRRPSASTSQRRKKSTFTKSPLQRLELTLDSMTKEEKRARIEAAERRAREKAARKAVASSADQPPELTAYSSHPRQPSVSYAQPEQPIVTAEAPLPREPPSTAEIPVGFETQLDPPPTRGHTHAQHRVYEPPAPRAREPVRATPVMNEQANIPSRSLSFRARAAREDLRFGREDGAVQPPRQEHSNGDGGFSLTRSGSNKLKKEPPGDPWYHVRTEAEQRIPPATRRDVQAADSRPRGSLPSKIRDKDLPPEPEDLRRPSAADDSGGYPRDGSEMMGIQRRATEPARRPEPSSRHAQYYPPGDQTTQFKQVPAERQAPIPPTAVRSNRFAGNEPSSNFPGHGREPDSAVMQARRGVYRAPQWLNEWTNAPVGTLSGSLLDMTREKPVSSTDRSKPWWEGSNRRSGYSYSTRPKDESSEGEYTDFNGPTRFKPPLHLECGPLLRYCGIRQDNVLTRSKSGGSQVRHMWRGSIMIVTRDSGSSYDVAPMLRMFVQDLEPLLAPPHDIDGELPPEYIDPIAGHPKLGRKGEMLFLRPVDHLEEGRDLSKDETANGLFEPSTTSAGGRPVDGSTDLTGTIAGRLSRIGFDGEKLQKYKDVVGFRLHTEHGCTFWRFNIEVELRDRQQRIAYRINRGPCNAFYVPASGEAMHVMFHSCNGFSIGTKTDSLNGPDPMWRDVLNNHQTSPFHVMVGGGDQIYNDEVADECSMFIDWLEIGDPAKKRAAPFSVGLQDQVENFYFRRYCQWFSTGLFGLANSQIPMVNMWSDRESFNGFGSYPHEDMQSPVLSGVGAVAFKYYMLFQHQSISPEMEAAEPSWELGCKPGPYVHEFSRNIYVSLGNKVALLAVDCRTERTENDVLREKTWEKVMDRVYAEVKRGHVEHLLVVFPVPLAYPRVAWLEDVLTSRAMNPIKALGKRGLLGKALSNLENGSEMMDDLRDHWTAKTHKDERRTVIEDLQDLAIDKSLRITILSGDVNMAAVGQFYSKPKLGLAKHKDPRYMPNIISSAMANMPPPDILADALNRRNKVHNFDPHTDEAMIPLFQHGVEGKPRNNKRLLPHRNWCSIRPWVPGNTPPPTPPPPEESPSPPPQSGSGSGLLRRLSLGGSGGQRPNMSKDSVRGSRPPVSGSGDGSGLFRSLSRGFSRRNSVSEERPERPGMLSRTLSLGRGNTERRGLFGLGRRDSQSRPDDGGINGQWGAESDEDDYFDPRATSGRQQVGLRGGAANEEYSDDDDSYFVARPPQRAQTIGATPMSRGGQDTALPPLKPFTRTPTGLSTKQMRNASNYEVDLEGGLDICLNVEVNARDPAGITVPYRLLVPRLDYQYVPGTDAIDEPEPVKEPSRFRKLLSLRRKDAGTSAVEDEDQYDDVEPEVEDSYQRQRY